MTLFNSSRKRIISTFLIPLMCLCLVALCLPSSLLAQNSTETNSTETSSTEISYTATQKSYDRVIKVAFFPMDGYHMTLSDGSRVGMDKAYLDNLEKYLDFDYQFVECDSWEDALDMLQNHQVDLVGSAQYTQERAKLFQYCSLASGSTFGAIAVEDGQDLAFEDFEKMEDLTYGIVDGYVRTEEFYQYMADNGVDDADVIIYKSTEAMMNALDAGEIDAVVHTFTEIRSGQNIIGEFAPSPFYYITYKGNTELTDFLDVGIAQLNLKKPTLNSELMSEYYGTRYNNSTVYSLAENEYIDNNPTINVGYLDNYYPFSYKEDGQFKGICREKIDEFCQETGYNANYVELTDSKSASAALATGLVDLLCYNTLTEEEIFKRGFFVTDAYASLPMVLVRHDDTATDSIKTVAVVSDLFTEASLSLDTDLVTLKNYSSQVDCLNAVSEGEVDAALCDGYLSEYFLGTRTEYEHLDVETILNVEHQICMVASGDMPEAFYSILEKGITETTDKEVSEYIIQNNAYTKMSLQSFINEHSVTIISLLVILLVFAFSMGIHMYRDSRKIKNLMYKDYNLDIWNLNYLTYESRQKLNQLGNRDRYVVVTLNVMQFRFYNTLYGWATGQRLLEYIVTLIRQLVSDKDEIYAHDQSDRFVLLLKYQDEDDLTDRLGNMKNIIEESILQKTKNSMTIVMGVSKVPLDSKDIELAITNSNIAMENAKDVNEDDIKFYDQEFAKQIKEEHEKEQLLKSVNVNKDFLTYYQAKVDIRNNSVVGAEALVRFADPSADGQIRSPAYFVPYYEQTGKIMEIDFFVFESTCQMLSRRLALRETVVPISCNFSRHHFMREGFADKVEAVLNRYKIPKDLIEVEITETLVVEELLQDMVRNTIEELRKRDIRISIDDFGSGYSSLGVFEQIPAAVIKLDRSFLLNQKDRKRQLAIMKGIVQMAENLDAQIVCEGVETEEDVELMQEIGAVVAQGYRYSKPVPEDRFEMILNDMVLLPNQ